MARILVIDDDAMVRDMLRSVLQGAGHSVEEAPDGKQGVRMCRSHPVDVVITDILMPEVDGAVAIRQLRRDFPHIKIIAMSGGGSIVAVETCLSLAKRFGSVKVFEKPVPHEDLLQAIRDAVG